MAKELPYFQFEPSEWQNGDIQMASNEAKIAFIEILCSYWQRLGSLPYAFALQRHCNGNENALLELLNCNAIKKIDGEIVISFLDNQFKELENKSQKARESAYVRWNKDKNADAMQTHTKRNANRIDKNRIDKSKEVTTKKSEKDFSDEVFVCYINCLKFFPQHLQPKNEDQKINWLADIEKINRIDEIPFEHLEKIISFGRSDSFWSNKFLSLLKLRKTNPEGIKYLVVLNEQMKAKKGNNSGKMTTEERQAANRRIFQKVMEGTK